MCNCFSDIPSNFLWYMLCSYRLYLGKLQAHCCSHWYILMFLWVVSQLTGCSNKVYSMLGNKLNFNSTLKWLVLDNQVSDSRLERITEIKNTQENLVRYAVKLFESCHKLFTWSSGRDASFSPQLFLHTVGSAVRLTQTNRSQTNPTQITADSTNGSCYVHISCASVTCSHSCVILYLVIDQTWKCKWNHGFLCKASKGFLGECSSLADWIAFSVWNCYYLKSSVSISSFLQLLYMNTCFNASFLCEILTKQLISFFRQTQHT